MGSVREIIATAIALMVQGNLDASLSLFRRALAEGSSSKEFCNGQPTLASDRRQRSHMGCPSTIDIVRLLDSRHWRPLILENFGDTFLSNDFDVFPALFIVSRPHHGDALTRPELELLQEAEVLALLYNYAFSLHMAGLASLDANRREESLRQALHVYQVASLSASLICLEDHPELCTLFLALAVNEGHIHSFYFHQDHVQVLHIALVRFLIFANGKYRMVLRRDYDFFKAIAVHSSFAKAKQPPMA